MMLSRIATPSTRLYATQARAFSMSFAPRFDASAVKHDAEDRTPMPEPRLNPLVGNYILQPAAKPTVEGPSKAPESSADFTLSPPPPPPPPPAVESSAPAAAAPKSEPPFYPYNAANSSNPMDIDLASIITNKAAAFGHSLGIGDPLQRPKIRTKAVAGRTVFIKSRVSPTSAPTPALAIRVLEKMCRDQKVRNKYHSQKFHERKGLKKKRLLSQRWRARFKTGFKAAVSKVLELKKQGW